MARLAVRIRARRFKRKRGCGITIEYGHGLRREGGRLFMSEFVACVVRRLIGEPLNRIASFFQSRFCYPQWNDGPLGCLLQKRKEQVCAVELDAGRRHRVPPLIMPALECLSPWNKQFFTRIEV